MEKPDFMKGIYIPPQPKIIEDVQNACPDLKKIATLIAKDAGISANILRTVNSSAFNLSNKIASIDQAVTLLGLDTVINIINGLMIRIAFENHDNDNLVEFWSLNEDLALCCSHTSRRLGLAQADKCYLLGLFHMCGIPALNQKFPEYMAIYREAITQNSISTETYISAKIKTTHAAVGYYIAHSWNIPNDICDALAKQLDTVHINGTIDPDTEELITVLKTSEAICQPYFRLMGVTAEHTSDIEFILTKLGMSEDDFEDLKDELRDFMQLA